jgi:hypothetical protein
MCRPRIQGINDLWILKAALGRLDKQAHLDTIKRAAQRASHRRRLQLRQGHHPARGWDSGKRCVRSPVRNFDFERSLGHFEWHFSLMKCPEFSRGTAGRDRCSGLFQPAAHTDNLRGRMSTIVLNTTLE